MQKAFLTVVLGGPSCYTGRGMGNAHAKAVSGGLCDMQFDCFWRHLENTLVELGVSDTQIQEVHTLTDNLREDIVGRSRY